MKNILSLLAVTFLFLNSVMAQNDLCDNAVTLTPGTSCSFTTGSFNGATISSPAPSCAASASQDVWFKFVATNPTNRIFLEGVFGLNHGFEVIEGNCTGSSIICVNSAASDFSELNLNNTYVVGQTYFIRVFKATAGLSTATFRICVETYPTPFNDLCANATVITPGATCNFTSSVFTGSSISTQAPNCAASASQDVWFQFVATNPTNRIFLEGVFGLNLGFEVFEGSCTGTSIVCVNSSGSDFSELFLGNNFTVGQTYYIRAFKTTAGLTLGTFRICVETYPTPSNDLCANATVITPGTTCNFTSSVFTGSSITTQAPTCAASASQDVWFQFVATNPTNRIFLEGVFGLNLGFEVFEGSCTGTSISCANASGSDFSELFLGNNFTVGQTYYIRAFKTTAGLTLGTFRICVETYPTPSNDLCANATVITPGTTCNFTSSVFTGSSITTQAPTCAASASQDVWFQFVATNPTNRIFLEGVFGLNLGFEVFEGSCTGTSISCANASGSDFSELFLGNNFTVGQTYYIRAFKTTAGLTLGTFRICVETYPTPSNDLCANATVITPGTTCNFTSSVFSGSSITTQAPNCAASASQDVWFQFVATNPTNRIFLEGVFGLNLGFEVFEGSCTGTSISCANASGSDFSELFLGNNFTVGQTYYIRAFKSTAGLTLGTFRICVETYPTAVNDLCANAQTVFPSTTCVAIPGTLAGSSISTVAPSCASNASQDVWYQFVATVSSMTISLPGVSNLNHGFEVFTGCDGTSIACINANGTDLSETTTVTNLVIGNTYFVRVFKATATIATSNFTICIFGAVQSTCTPQVSIAASPTSICQGTSVTFNATPTFGGNNPSYQWKINSNNVGTNSATFATSSLNNSDQVTCVMTSNAACATSVTATSNSISGIVNPIPVVSIDFTGGVLEATAGFSSYQWTFEGNIIVGAVTNNFMPTQTGIYGVAVVDNSNCSSSTTFNLTSLASASFNQSKIVVFPNPVKRVLNFVSLDQVNQVIVFDMAGRILHSELVDQNAIDLSSLQSGHYLLKIETSIGTSIVKIIKE